jgi:hypothetical protein
LKLLQMGSNEVIRLLGREDSTGTQLTSCAGYPIVAAVLYKLVVGDSGWGSCIAWSFMESWALEVMVIAAHKGKITL